jgi:hypothetical protein
MYSMLLPLDTSAARHLEDGKMPPGGAETGPLHDQWSNLVGVLSSKAESSRVIKQLWRRLISQQRAG